MRWRDEIDTVGLEACPLSEWPHRHLIEVGFNAVCVEVRHTQRFLSTRPVKTDRNDARGLAEMMREIVEALLQMHNTIRGLLRTHEIKVGKVHRNKFADRIRELLVTERSSLDAKLRQVAKGDEVCRRLMTIPGVGPIASIAFRATVDDPNRFPTCKVVGAHFGLTPRIYQSGETDWHDPLPQALPAPGLGHGDRAATWSQEGVRGGGAQARGDHAPHVGLRDRVRVRRGGVGASRRVGNPHRFPLPDRILHDGAGQSVTIPAGARSGRTARSRIGRPGSSRTPSWGGGDARPRTEARSGSNVATSG